MLNPWIVRAIKNAAQTELKDQDEKLLNDLWDLIYNAFKIWKLNHGDKNPKIIGGLLATAREIKFEDAEPWECAGLAYPSRLSLALMLIGQDDPNFMDLLAVGKLRTVLALLIDREADSYVNDDLFFAYDILIKKQSKSLGVLETLHSNWDQIVAGEKQLRNLAKGNAVASKNKSMKADAYHELWRAWAKETWKAHPYWTVEKVATHVLDVANRHNHKMANGNPYEIKTIKRIITGIKQSLKTEN